MSVLTAHAMAIGYGATRVADGIDLTLQAGQVTCLLGPNGVGKTTLFKTLLGLIPPLAGSVHVEASDITTLSRSNIARRVAYVPQTVAGDFAFTVLDLVVMGRTAYLGPFATPGPADRDIAMQALDAMGIASLAQRDATRISGGQRQLALIARALAQQARLIVMDEPTASLDLANRLRVLDRITALAADGMAVLVSTHEPEHAFSIAHQVAILGADKKLHAGPPHATLTAAALSRLYGLDLQVEHTPAGRLVVSRASIPDGG